MKAAVYFGERDIRCTSIPDATLDVDHGVLVEVLATSICGSDLHMYRGAMDDFMLSGSSQTGHELCGRVLETGSAVGNFKKGDRISMAYSCSCGDCYMCHVGQTAHCLTTSKAVYGFGAPFGDMNGTHAEALVLPHADAHAMLLPEGISDQAALTLSCNLPAAYIANELANVQPGETVALIGAGPTGLMALDILLSQGASNVTVFDPLAYRLTLAADKGAQIVDLSSVDLTAGDDPLAVALEITKGIGFDKVIEMVGFRESLRLAIDIVRPGGTVAALGVFTDADFELPLADSFLRNITLHMNGFASVQPYMWRCLRLLERGVINPDEYFTHRYSLDDVDKAFADFADKSDNIVKTLIKP